MNELRFDISRLPRVDQYQALMTDSELSATDIPSDIKTVVYFVQAADGLGGGTADPTSTGVGQGLMRAELDRAVAAFAEMNGDTTSTYAGAKLVAEEVTAIEFQYFDGAAWTPDWNSDEMGGLPVAVEVLLTLQPTMAMSEEEIAELGTGSEALLPEPQTYRLVVRLPVAVSAQTRELELAAEETAAAEVLPSEPSGTQTAGSGSSGSGGTGGTGGGNSGGGSAGGGKTGGGNSGGGNQGGGDRPTRPRNPNDRPPTDRPPTNPRPPDGPPTDRPMPPRPMPR
jgi:hypothetical protein